MAEFMDSASVAPRRADAVPRWDVDADVVVVGLGCAGASAARRRPSKRARRVPTS
jgi:hypothetical protein